MYSAESLFEPDKHGKSEAIAKEMKQKANPVDCILKNHTLNY